MAVPDRQKRSKVKGDRRGHIAAPTDAERLAERQARREARRRNSYQRRSTIKRRGGPDG